MSRKKRTCFYKKNGYGDLVIMSIEAYEELIETKAVDTAITEAENEFRQDGVLLDAKESLSQLRRKHLG